MTIDSSTSKRSMGTMFKKIAVAAAFGACSFAQAGVLDFEGYTGAPFMTSSTSHTFGKYWVESYGGTAPGDLVGAIVDGADNDLCIGISCPVNNKSNYYAALDDGYLFFGLTDNSNFMVKSLQASFIGAGQVSYPATAGLLVLQGFDAFNALVGNGLQIGLSGPNAAGNFNFSTYDLSGTTFGKTYFSSVRVLGYACDASGSCSRAGDLGNIALDNVVTVPEPTTWAMFGLGLIGLSVFSRRHSA